MPETAVLANLSIDSSGVVTGIKQSNAALGQGDAALVRFGGSQKALAGTTDLLVGKMFSMGSAVKAIGRSLGIVGVVLALAAGLKKLVTDLVESTTWFKRAKEAVTDWYNSLIKGEDAVGRLSRKLKELGATAGPAAGLAKLRELANRQKEITRLLSEGSPPVQAPVAPVGVGGIGGLALSAFTRGPATVDKSAAAAASVLRIEMVEAQREINETIKTLTFLGVTSEQIAEATGTAFKAVPPTLKELEEAAKKAAAELEASLDAALEFRQIVDVLGQRRLKLFDLAGILPPEQVEARIKAIGDALLALDSTAVNFSVGVDNLAKEMIGLGFTADEVKQKFLDLGVVWEDITPDTGVWKQWADGLHEALDQGAVWFEVFQASVQAVGSAVSNALVGTSTSAKKSIATLLADLSRMLITYSLMFLAMGIAGTVNPAAQLLFGPPGPNFAAAKVFAVAGVAAGLASRALGGPEGSSAESSGGGGGGRGGRNRGGDTTNQTITVVVQGSVDDPNAFARKIAALINTNRADGARA